VIGAVINTVFCALIFPAIRAFPQLPWPRAGSWTAIDWRIQNVRFEQVLKYLRPNDYPSHHTLFRLNFICQRRPLVKPQEFAGISSR